MTMSRTSSPSESPLGGRLKRQKSPLSLTDARSSYAALVQLVRNVVLGDWPGAAMAGRVATWRDVAEAAVAHDVLPVASRAWAIDDGAACQVPARWQSMAQASTRRSLALAADVVTVVGALRAASVDCLVLKGAPLALQAYGSLSLRDAGDIDLLVDVEELGSALHVLYGLGYRVAMKPVAPGRKTQVYQRVFARFAAMGLAAALEDRDDADFAAYLHLTNEITLTREGGRVVDLHWKPFRNGYLKPFTPGAGRCEVSVAGVPIPVPLPVESACYLAVHALVHRWDRLKWLMDIPMLLRSTCVSVEELMSAAEERDLAVPVALALHLSADLLGYPDSRELTAAPLSAFGSRMVSWAHERLAERDAPTPARWGLRSHLLVQVACQPGWRARVRTVEDLLVPAEWLVDWTEAPALRTARLALMGMTVWARGAQVGTEPVIQTEDG